jgi:hypothetical protein
MPRLIDRSLKEIFKEARILIILIVGIVSLPIAHLSVLPEWFRELVKLVGHALVVAVILVVLVDVWVKDKLVRDAAKDISHHLLGWGLPQELQEHIREVVQKTDRVMEQSEVSYRLSRGEADVENRTVTIDVQSSYEVRNYGSTTTEYGPELSVEGMYHPQLISFDFHQQSGEASKECEREEDHTTKVVTFSGAKSYIQPHGQNSDPCRVFWHFRMVMPENYSDIFVFSRAAINLTLSARYQKISNSSPPLTGEWMPPRVAGSGPTGGHFFVGSTYAFGGVPRTFVFPRPDEGSISDRSDREKSKMTLYRTGPQNSFPSELPVI